MRDPLRQTLLAEVYQVAKETPLQLAKKISTKNNCTVYLKREDLQSVHSFKIRGAYNKLRQLSEADKAKGVITASAGNHAQGVALGAKQLGVSAMIVMPVTTPLIKIEAVEGHGAEVVLAGDSYSDAYQETLELIEATGRTFIHPFDDVAVIAGQGTVGREILEQLPSMTHVFVPIGGGGLIAGIAQYVKSLRPDIKVIGVEPVDSNAMGKSLRAGKRISLSEVGIFADGVAVKQVGKQTFAITKKYVDEVITVDTDQICASMKDIFEDTRSIMEPAGALAVAGINKYDLAESVNAVAICSGANMTFERLQQVAERTLLGSGREALFAVKMPEKAGALKLFCERVISGYSITEFNYRLYRHSEANVLVGVSVAGEAGRQRFIASMAEHGFAYVDLSDDDIAKEHIRHMIGGESPEARDESFYQIDFPERPGALANFLKIIGDRWNISAFHYRSAASDTGNVMIALETDNASELEKLLDQTGYKWRDINQNKAVGLFVA